MAAWCSPRSGEPFYPDTVTALMKKLISQYNNKVVACPSAPACPSA
jgi:hypothetical protein